MSYTIVRPADHAGWLAERAKGIGSSDAGTIMGASPFSTPLKLWRLKKGLDPPIPETDTMRNGHILEPAVAEYFAMVTHSTIDKTSEGDWLAVDDKKPYLRVSPDRLFWPEGAEMLPENRLVLEIKSTSKFVDPENLPLYWYCQIQYQMGVLGIELGAIAWITSNPKLEFGYKWIPFNPAFFNTLISQIDEFWNNNILKDIEPDPRSSEDAAIKWPFSETDKVTIASGEDYLNCQNYIQLTSEMEGLQKRLDEVTAAIKTSIGNAETLIFEDPETGDKKIIAKNKSVTEKVFEEDKFEQEHPDVYRNYMKKFFDKKEFADEDPILYKQYTTTRKGYRRFSVCIK